MNGIDARSGRSSGRVAGSGKEPGVRQPIGPFKAPESSTHHATPTVASGYGGRRVSRRRLVRIERDLSEREQAILTDLDRFRFLTSGQLQTLHFHDHANESAAARIRRRVLARLGELRVVEHLERRVGGIRAGSASYVWRVGVVGDRLLRRQSGEGVRSRTKEPSARYLDHCLAVGACHIELVVAGRGGRLELMKSVTEPASWRRYFGVGGAREVLKPDLYVVTASGEFEDHWFIEIDRATESIPTLLRKCAQYERYRRSGDEQSSSGVFPRVVWVVPDQMRQARLTTEIGRTRNLDADLFRVTTLNRFAELVAGGSA